MSDFRSVAIVQRRLTHYRVALFERLRETLAKKNIELQLIVGDPTPTERTKRDEGKISWAQHVPCSYVLGERICWHPFGKAIDGIDLLIVPQEMKLIYNLVPILRKRDHSLAYWGHGRNFQAGRSSRFKEAIRRPLLRRADWWFAYTELSAMIVRDAGFPASRITCVNNSIDTESLCDQLDSVSHQELAELRRSLRIGDRDPVAIYCGSLYEEKQIPLLIEAAIRIRELVPNFHLIVVGAGPLSQLVASASQSHNAIHHIGVLNGHARARYLKLADVFLNPGLVGLGIIDAFCAGLPIVTTRTALHSPEIQYLNDGENGLYAPDTAHGFALAVAKLLETPEQVKRLSVRSRLCATEYSLSSMITRFAQGVSDCLNLAHGNSTQPATVAFRNSDRQR